MTLTNSLLLLSLALLFSGVVYPLGIDRKNVLQNLSHTNCAPTSFSACAFSNVQLLVIQALQDLNASRFNENQFNQVISLITSDPLAYRLGSGFAVNLFDGNMNLLASGYWPDMVGSPFNLVLKEEKILSSINLPSIYYEAGANGGSWVEDVYFSYAGAVATNPTPRMTWVDGIYINGSLFIAASSFDNVDTQLIGRACDGSLFADCSLGASVNIANLVVSEINSLLTSSETTYWASLSTSPQYSPPNNFSVTVVRASDGMIMGHSGRSSYAGKPISSVNQGLLPLLQTSVLGGSTWFTYTWVDGGATYLRQSQAFLATPQDGLSYYVFSGYGVTSQSKCPPCNCPNCPYYPACPICPEITDCDGTEVTNIKMDFQGMF